MAFRYNTHMSQTISIHLNGDERTFQAKLSVNELITQLDLIGKRLAVEVNGEIVPRSAHAQYHLANNDKVEIIHAVGGG